GDQGLWAFACNGRGVFRNYAFVNAHRQEHYVWRTLLYCACIQGEKYLIIKGLYTQGMPIDGYFFSRSMALDPAFADWGTIDKPVNVLFFTRQGML
ncbi:MAG: hypothetical protein RIS28_1453, partial [Bacteroidota bacterium]